MLLPCAGSRWHEKITALMNQLIATSQAPRECHFCGDAGRPRQAVLGPTLQVGDSSGIGLSPSQEIFVRELLVDIVTKPKRFQDQQHVRKWVWKAAFRRCGSAHHDNETSLPRGRYLGGFASVGSGSGRNG